MPLRLSALNRKLLRDLLAMRGQAVAIAMVVAAGVSMYVMYLSNFASLQGTRAAYYSQQRFADVFASMKRAPERVAGEIAGLPGVTAIETRVVASVTLDLEQLDEPATARLVSIPADRRPRVNDLFLRRGRWIEPGRRDEVLASEGFVTAHGLNPGDQVRAVINGRLRRLTIVGVALSPEFIYSIRPGELVPDDKRYAHLLDGPAGARRRLRHGRRVQRCRAQACARQRARRDHRPARSHPRALRRAGCDPAGRCSSRTGPWKTSSRSSRASASCCPLVFLHGRRLHPERGAHARAGAAAIADRGAEGARLRQPLDRMALPEMGAGHRRDGRRDRARGRRLARPT